MIKSLLIDSDEYVTFYYLTISIDVVLHVTADFDGFWLFVEREMKMPIPSCIKYLLKYSGFENCHTISKIEEIDLKLIENDVRKASQKDDFPNGFGVLDFSIKLSENFEFSRGHQKLILAIAKLVKQKLNEGGVDAFSMAKPKKRAIENPNGAPTKILKFSTTECSPQEHVSEASNLLNVVRERKSVVLRKMILSLITNTPEMFANVSINSKYIIYRRKWL